MGREAGGQEKMRRDKGRGGGREERGEAESRSRPVGKAGEQRQKGRGRVGQE